MKQDDGNFWQGGRPSAADLSASHYTLYVLVINIDGGLRLSRYDVGINPILVTC